MAAISTLIVAVTGAVLWAELPVGGACSFDCSELPDDSDIVILGDVVVVVGVVEDGACRSDRRLCLHLPPQGLTRSERRPSR